MRFSIFFLLYNLILLNINSTETFSKKQISKSYSFAEYLWNQKEYYRAMVEYQRSYFSLPKGKLKSYGILRANESLFKGKQYQKSINELEKGNSNFFYTRYNWLKALSYAKLKNYTTAKQNLLQTTFYTQYQNLLWDIQQSLKYDTQYFKKEWRRKIKELSSKPLPLSKVTKMNVNNLKKLQKLEKEWPFQHQKNPHLAALYSILLPGAGYLYTDNLGNAISSFLIVGTSTLISIIAFNSSENLLGYSMGSIGTIFYLGNIYGSYKQAQIYNNQILKKYKDNIASLSVQYKVFTF